MFVGRNAELKFLEHYYRQKGSHILVVYGQRGVGKTTLLKHFVENKTSTYYAARACSDREQRYQWACELADEEIEISRYPEYHELFERLVEQKNAGKLVILIEEFHHLLKGDGFFLEKAAAFLQGLPQDLQVMFVLCTSASGWVENSMAGRIGSAALSIHGLLKVREMKFEEICRVFSGYSKNSYIENYAVLGGIPGLWKSFSPEFDTRENLIHNLLSKESRLYRELSVFMSEQLREPAVYNTILAAMARGCQKLNDIYKHTGFSRAKISVYLKNLMELELVEKVFSFDLDGNSDTQKGVYRITNPCVRFYFRFLFANETLLQNTSPEIFYQRKIADAYPEYVEEAYRRICREALGTSGKNVGEWLGKSGNLDIVAGKTDGRLIVANCSYAGKMRLEDYEWLLFCAEKAKIKNAVFRLYSENGFDEKLHDMAARGEVALCCINMD